MFNSENGRHYTSTIENQLDTVQAIGKAFGSAKKVLVGTHEHPDGDALGSALAVYHALKAEGKDVAVHIPDAAPPFFSFLPGHEALTTQNLDASKFDLLILVDCTQANRAHLEAEIAVHPNSIVIDHHHGNPKQATINLVVPEAAATAHILFDVFQTLHIPFSKNVATCLLTGIFTDTGSFMHDSVSPDLLEIASFLMTKGARLSHIAHETYQKKDLPGLKIWGRALSRILTTKSGPSIAVITKEDLDECQATLDDLDGVVNMLNTLPDSTFALLLTEFEPGKIKGSLRSEPHKGVNVSEIAKRLGGGGHKLASGFEVKGHIVQKEGKWRIMPARQAGQ